MFPEILDDTILVLNLVINGIPSILRYAFKSLALRFSFKPCYKWNTFNTEDAANSNVLIASFKPCYKWNTFNTLGLEDIPRLLCSCVLNLVINGIPSILTVENETVKIASLSFKPCYKWNTFNTRHVSPYQTYT